MRCHRCQHENPTGTKFCGQCGTALAVQCSSCGAANPADNKFCGQCAAALAAAQLRFVAPETYTPKHLAERILTSKAALEGERKHVTVLFADLKGSMELLADRDPEEARKILDPVLEHMIEAVHRYEGTVNQVMGDGIMALFGAPLAHEDHAVRACSAALWMQESVKRHAEAVSSTVGVTLQIRVGLNSGEVVVRSIRNDLHMDYSAIGQTTHLAARMEQIAAPGTILATARTAKLVEGQIHTTALEPTAVKGVKHLVHVFAVEGYAHRHWWHSPIARGRTPFLGRERELDDLYRALTEVGDGRGQVAGVAGEAGIGKSRFCYEFLRSAEELGCRIVAGHTVSYRRTTPYLLITELLRSYFGIESHDHPDQIRDMVARRVRELDPTLTSFTPAYLALLNMPVDDASWDRLHPSQRRQLTIDSVTQLFADAARVEPFIVLVEDLHWADSETQAVVDALVQRLPDSALLLVATYRLDYRHTWHRHPWCRDIALEPLPHGVMEQYLDEWLGPDGRLKDLKALIVGRAEGNPFFLEQIVHMLVETETLSGVRGDYQLAEPVERVDVPVSVQVLLASRIDRLSQEDKRLLQSAAVVGKDVSSQLVAAITDLDERVLSGMLARLQDAAFLEATTDGNYTFKHALTHEVAYRSLLQDQRRMLHARIVAAIEADSGTRVAEHIERLAHHAFQGEVWDKAVGYLREAGRLAAQRSAHREAAGRFEQALVALGHLPDGPGALEAGIDLRVELRDSLLTLGAGERVGAVLGEARDKAEVLRDPRRLALVLSRQSNYSRMSGDLSGARDLAERSISIAKTVEDRWLDVETSYELAMAFGDLGDYRGAAHGMRRLVGFSEGTRRGGPGIAAIHTRTWLAVFLAALGEFPEAQQRADEALAIAESVGYNFSLMHACLAVGHVHAHRGHADAAIPILERGLAIGQAGGFKASVRSITTPLALAYMQVGRAADALKLIEREALLGGQFSIGHAALVTAQGQAYLQLGRLADASAAATDALRIARHHGARGTEAYALQLQGRIYSAEASRNAAQAFSAYAHVAERAKELGMNPLLAHCHRDTGKLYGCTGERDAAKQELGVAASMYDAMGMRFWLEQAEAEMQQFG